ncbi:dihydrofolate reductase family protein [Kribbella sp. NPDC051587]|uniref:dihydrofolate reductase family protein n=1 Tax=Kribbella sp. NPDC051587 TaxID=3364119 RepID=UPI0037B2C736
MTATFTFDIFSTLDGFGAHNGDWGGYFGKQGPEFLEHRAAQFAEKQRMVYGATTYLANAEMLSGDAIPFEALDKWVTLMRDLPATVVSSKLQGPLDWPDATIASEDGVAAVRRLKEESDVPLRSHGSLALNKSLLAAGLVDRVQVTVFPVIAGQTGLCPVFGGVADLDLELLESRTLDGNTQELIYRPTLHG